MTAIAGAGVNRDMREIGFHQFRRLECTLHIVDGKHECPGLAGLRGFQN